MICQYVQILVLKIYLNYMKPSLECCYALGGILGILGYIIIVIIID